MPVVLGNRGVCSDCITQAFPGVLVIGPNVSIADDADVSAIQEFLLAPPNPDPHNPTTLAKLEATATWLARRTELLAVPPPPEVGEDIYAAVRTRKTAETDAAFAAVEALGGPI